MANGRLTASGWHMELAVERRRAVAGMAQSWAAEVEAVAVVPSMERAGHAG